MGFIYIIENDVNDKVYVGQTRKTIQKRFEQHKDSVTKSGRTLSKIYAAMRDIGIEHFTIRQLEECDDTKLNDREIYYIDKYDSFRNGYNSTAGGNCVTKTYEPDFLTDLFLDYSLGEPIIELCRKYRINRGYLNKLCQGVDRIETNRKITQIPSDLALVMYTTNFEPQCEITMEKAFNIIKREITNLNKPTFFREVYISTATGNRAYGHRWQLKEELFYDNKTFRSIFDIDAYKNGDRFEIIDGYAVCDKAFETIPGIVGIDYKCCICGKEIKTDRKYCDDCLNKIHMDSSIFYKGKPKIGKDELQLLISKGLSLVEIGQRYGVSGNTIKKCCIYYDIKYKGVKSRNTQGLTLVLGDTKQYYSKALDAARYLIDTGISKSNSITSLAYQLSMAAKSGNRILGIYVEIGNTTNIDAAIVKEPTYEEKHGVNKSGLTITFGDTKIYFEKTIDAAKFLTKNNLAGIKRMDQLSYKLGVSAKQGKLFNGLKVELGNTLNNNTV